MLQDQQPFSMGILNSPNSPGLFVRLLRLVPAYSSKPNKTIKLCFSTQRSLMSCNRRNQYHRNCFFLGLLLATSPSHSYHSTLILDSAVDLFAISSPAGGRQSCQPASRPLPCGPAGQPAPCSPAGRPNWLAGWLIVLVCSA